MDLRGGGTPYFVSEEGVEDHCYGSEGDYTARHL